MNSCDLPPASLHTKLKVSIGQFTSAGVKSINQDAIAYRLPKDSDTVDKGIALAIADGISTSDVSHIASNTAVTAFLDDYFCTSELWSTRTAGERVIQATNSWLCSRARESWRSSDSNKGYVCTLTTMVIKDNLLHIFHVGDSRVYRLNSLGLEKLTNDHRLIVSAEESYLARALGVDEGLKIDYVNVALNKGDIFIAMTDGVYEHMDTVALLSMLHTPDVDLSMAARQITERSLQLGSRDNLSIQLIRIESVANTASLKVVSDTQQLSLPPELKEGDLFDGYQVCRLLHSSSRSKAFLVVDLESQKRLVLKVPALGMTVDEQYLERFLLEEWIARRIHSAHVIKAAPTNRDRHYLYSVTEYIEGQTLEQWIADHPAPDLNEVRAILEQISTGLRAFHRMEMIHQDLKPDNIVIDAHGTVKIIDLGATYVAGVAESQAGMVGATLQGTALYAAPEYFLGEYGSILSDQYSLGVIAYHMLSGEYPYGTNVAKSTTTIAQNRLQYRPLSKPERAIPVWVDMAIAKAVHINPEKRYALISEFIYDLKTPNQRFINRQRPPLLERDPVTFWQWVSAIMTALLIWTAWPQ
ncbi:serine/threonine-protein kinase PknD [Microbulbifer aestuariivivens]|uniref:non-specific serine/threonine protein kinase n=1 Tax=Microbulbifer aestuariivivens TaxID=1908308 RepID=A0ABP9WTS5_9GAMM